MEHQQPKGVDSAAFTRVWNRVSAANGSSRVETAAPQPMGQEGDTAGFLRQQIWDSLTRWRTCGHWAGNHPAAPLLRQLAGEEAQGARRMSAALFLRTGERYFPSREVKPLEAGNWQEGLRQVYLSNIQAEGAFRRAAMEPREAGQAALWQGLAQEAQSRVRRIEEALSRWGV